MSALDKFRGKTGVQVSAGATYQRLAYVDASGVAGADADVEFDEESGRIRVTVTEWEKTGSGAPRYPVMRVEFDASTGRVIGDDEDALGNLLAAVDGMRILGNDEVA